MPERIDATRATFLFGIVSGERVPSLVLAVGREVMTMPALQRDRQRPVEDWRLMARVALCVLDGPDDEGFLIGPLAPAQVDQQMSWCEAVDQRGSAAVVLLADTALPEALTADELPARLQARGGVVRAVPSG